MPGDSVYPIEAVTVYAASGARVDKKFIDHAYDLGAAIAREGWVQVNGGGETGLMGAATRGGLDANGIVDCVNLRMFATTNQSKGFRKVYIEDTIQDRKNGLYERGDAIVALPGGLGTLDEIAEQMCMRQLQFHTKPIVLINTNGHYNPIRDFIRNGEESLFISGGMSQVIHFSDTPADAIQYLKDYKPITVNKESVNSSELNALHQ
ncbi:putative cytokinin riboside 5'-monophosphate phosphoribohydrolase LOGL7 [Gracilariopsis chorda]|uniref:Putative cytokinin riboside 5'-monophosphate phosphoribohydrolase LOGL7 n=1 Tax=Gracilariopsis chorda TaxID=448386 RepID=A0A2V3J280_9FLOR|nr:putative cytokinin riboside 5'-monophosphate phosphoribohydrolase LOGL7 [Gracilariopsis chorda]|eukprot:PXF47500.1 putative cytokinin riboside 5'-monophosphate phosphoribohydrolase LOGL7 [Gracilariopsis chorda]